MKKLPYKLVAAVCLCASMAGASTIDVTNTPLVTLQTSDSLIFTISANLVSCGRNIQYPGEIEMLLGSMPLGGPAESIPGTSSVYLPGILFNGTIESMNGGISIPLDDPDAGRLGLPTGDLLLTPGEKSGGSYSGAIDLLSADAMLTTQQAAALFSAGGEVQIELTNIGAPVTFGYAGTPIANDFTSSVIANGGSSSEGARVIEVDCRRPSPTPEPGTVGLLLIGLGAIGQRMRIRRRT